MKPSSADKENSRGLPDWQRWRCEDRRRDGQLLALSYYLVVTARLSLSGEPQTHKHTSCPHIIKINNLDKRLCTTNTSADFLSQKIPQQYFSFTVGNHLTAGGLLLSGMGTFVAGWRTLLRKRSITPQLTDQGGTVPRCTPRRWQTPNPVHLSHHANLRVIPVSVTHVAPWKVTRRPRLWDCRICSSTRFGHEGTCPKGWKSSTTLCGLWDQAGFVQYAGARSSLQWSDRDKTVRRIHYGDTTKPSFGRHAAATLATKLSGKNVWR